MALEHGDTTDDDDDEDHSENDNSIQSNLINPVLPTIASVQGFLQSKEYLAYARRVSRSSNHKSTKHKKKRVNNLIDVVENTLSPSERNATSASSRRKNIQQDEAVAITESPKIIKKRRRKTVTSPRSTTNTNSDEVNQSGNDNSKQTNKRNDNVANIISAEKCKAKSTSRRRKKPQQEDTVENTISPQIIKKNRRNQSGIDNLKQTNQCNNNVANTTSAKKSRILPHDTDSNDIYDPNIDEGNLSDNDTFPRVTSTTIPPSENETATLDLNKFSLIGVENTLVASRRKKKIQQVANTETAESTKKSCSKTVPHTRSTTKTYSDKKKQLENDNLKHTNKSNNKVENTTSAMKFITKSDVINIPDNDTSPRVTSTTIPLSEIETASLHLKRKSHEFAKMAKLASRRMKELKQNDTVQDNILPKIIRRPRRKTDLNTRSTTYKNSNKINPSVNDNLKHTNQCNNNVENTSSAKKYKHVLHDTDANVIFDPNVDEGIISDNDTSPRVTSTTIPISEIETETLDLQMKTHDLASSKNSDEVELLGFDDSFSFSESHLQDTSEDNDDHSENDDSFQLSTQRIPTSNEQDTSNINTRTPNNSQAATKFMNNDSAKKSSSSKISVHRYPTDTSSRKLIYVNNYYPNPSSSSYHRLAGIKNNLSDQKSSGKLKKLNSTKNKNTSRIQSTRTTKSAIARKSNMNSTTKNSSNLLSTNSSLHEHIVKHRDYYQHIYDTHKFVSFHYSKKVYIRVENESKLLQTSVPHFSYSIPKKKSPNPFPLFSSSGAENTIDLTLVNESGVETNNISSIIINDEQKTEILNEDDSIPTQLSTDSDNNQVSTLKTHILNLSNTSLKHIIQTIHSSKEFYVSIYPRIDELSLIHDKNKFKRQTGKNRRSQIRLFLRRNAIREFSSVDEHLTDFCKKICEWLEKQISTSLLPSYSDVHEKLLFVGIRNNVGDITKINLSPSLYNTYINLIRATIYAAIQNIPVRIIDYYKPSPVSQDQLHSRSIKQSSTTSTTNKSSNFSKSSCNDNKIRCSNDTKPSDNKSVKNNITMVNSRKNTPSTSVPQNRLVNNVPHSPTFDNKQLSNGSKNLRNNRVEPNFSSVNEKTYENYADSLKSWLTFNGNKSSYTSWTHNNSKKPSYQKSAQDTLPSSDNIGSKIIPFSIDYNVDLSTNTLANRNVTHIAESSQMADIPTISTYNKPSETDSNNDNFENCWNRDTHFAREKKMLIGKKLTDTLFELKRKRVVNKDIIDIF